jgi:hypothetical protein
MYSTDEVQREANKTMMLHLIFGYIINLTDINYAVLYKNFK